MDNKCNNYLKVRFLWLITACFYALDYFQHTAPSVLIVPISHSLQVDVVVIGNIMSIYFPIYAVMQIPAGYLLDNYPLRYVLSIACFIVSLGLILMIYPIIYTLIIGRVLVAIGSAFAFLGALKAASLFLKAEVFPLAIGLVNSIGVAGALFGQPLLNYLILSYGWRYALTFIIFCGLILAFLLLLFLGSTQKKIQVKKHTSKDNKIKLKTILFDKNIIFIALYAGIMVGVIVNAFAELYDVVFLEKIFHVGSEKASIISSMIFIGIGIGGPCNSILAKRFKYLNKWMIISCTFTIILFILIILSSILKIKYESWLFFLYFASGFCVSSMLLSFAFVKNIYIKSHHAIIFAFINMIIGICGFIFQFLLGKLLEILGHNYYNHDKFFISFLILLLPLLLSLFFCIKLKKVHYACA